MNNKGQAIIVWIAVAFVFVIVLFTFIDPLKESLDNIRGTSSLNCQGTVGFNKTQFDNDTNQTINRLTRRPTCFATGMTLFWLVVAVLIAIVAWVARNSSKSRRKIRR